MFKSLTRASLMAFLNLAAVTALSMALVMSLHSPASAQGKPDKKGRQSLQELADDPVACPDGSYLRLDPNGSGIWECLSGADLIESLFDLSDVLAIAYINKDGIDGFDQFTDTLIAKVVDSDEQPGLSVGDTIITHKYPTDFEGGEGSFGQISHKIGGISTSNTEKIEVHAATSNESFIFSNNQFAEIYSEGQAQTIQRTHISDSRWYGHEDSIRILLTSPSTPLTGDIDIDGTDISGTDDPFIDVDIINPGL